MQYSNTLNIPYTHPRVSEDISFSPSLRPLLTLKHATCFPPVTATSTPSTAIATLAPSVYAAEESTTPSRVRETPLIVNTTATAPSAGDTAIARGCPPRAALEVYLREEEREEERGEEREEERDEERDGE